MVVLVFGTSHTGKTLLAQKILEKYKFPYLSIDHLKMGLIRSGNTNLTPEECQNSIRRAKDFFRTHFPDYKYKAFTCHSWLLDRTLTGFLPEESNIIYFQNMFCVVHNDPSDAILRYVFRWNTTRENMKHAVCASAFAERIKKNVLKGGRFHETYGYLDI